MASRDMTPDDVHARLDAIRAQIADDEVAHSEEDRLHQDVLEAIAAGAVSPARLAELALKTRDMSFSRWYA